MTNPWLCDSLRLSALWRNPSGAESVLAWEVVGGGTPEARESQPRQGTTREVGPIGDGTKTLELRTAPGRADWLLLPTVTPAMLIDPARATPNIGQIADAIQSFDLLLFEKAAEAYAAPRFALGLTTVHPAADRGTSYAELKSLLGSMTLNLDGASDFQYQINRPRESKTLPGLVINRLSRWGSVIVTGIAMIPNLPGIQAHSFLTQFKSPPAHATRIELDISTSADHESVLPQEARVPLFREMIGLAAEIIENGDRP